MRDDLRERFFTPFVLPVTVIGVTLLIGISLSRILLTVSEIGAALVALLAAGYIMAMAFFVEARRRIPPRSLGVALAVGLLGLIAAGAAAEAAGMRAVEHGEEAPGGGAAGEAGEAGGGTEPLWVAIDIDYEQAPEALPPGEIQISLENEGSIEHNVVFEGVAGEEPIVEAAGGASDQGTVTLEPGEYVYYCSVPGHRTTMEGTLAVEEGAGGATGGGASEGASEAGSEATTGGEAGGSEAAGDAASEGASEAGASEPGAR